MRRLGERCWSDAYLGEKVGFEGDDVFGCFATVKFAKQTGGSFGDGGVGVGFEIALPIFGGRKDPKLRDATLDQESVDLVLVGERFQGTTFFARSMFAANKPGEAFEGILERTVGKFFDELIPLFLNGHLQLWTEFPVNSKRHVFIGFADNLDAGNYAFDKIVEVGLPSKKFARSKEEVSPTVSPVAASGNTAAQTIVI